MLADLRGEVQILEGWAARTGTAPMSAEDLVFRTGVLRRLEVRREAVRALEAGLAAWLEAVPPTPEVAAR